MSINRSNKMKVFKLIFSSFNTLLSSISANDRVVIPKIAIRAKPANSKALTNLFFFVISYSPTASSNLRATPQYFNAKTQKILDVVVIANI